MEGFGEDDVFPAGDEVTSASLTVRTTAAAHTQAALPARPPTLSEVYEQRCRDLSVRPHPRVVEQLQQAKVQGQPGLLLVLSHVQLTDRDWDALGLAITACAPWLVALDFSGVVLGQQGSMQLATICLRLVNLQLFTAHECSLDDALAVPIIQALTRRAGQPLRLLNLSVNRLGSKSASALLELLATPAAQLRSLVLDHTRLGSAFYIELAKIPGVLSCMQFMSLRGAGVNFAGGRVLLDILSESFTLLHCHLDHNSIPAAQLQRCRALVERNRLIAPPGLVEATSLARCATKSGVSRTPRSSTPSKPLSASSSSVKQMSAAPSTPRDLSGSKQPSEWAMVTPAPTAVPIPVTADVAATAMTPFDSADDEALDISALRTADANSSKKPAPTTDMLQPHIWSEWRRSAAPLQHVPGTTSAALLTPAFVAPSSYGRPDPTASRQGEWNWLADFDENPRVQHLLQAARELASQPIPELPTRPMPARTAVPVIPPPAPTPAPAPAPTPAQPQVSVTPMGMSVLPVSPVKHQAVHGAGAPQANNSAPGKPTIGAPRTGRIPSLAELAAAAGAGKAAPRNAARAAPAAPTAPTMVTVRPSPISKPFVVGTTQRHPSNGNGNARTNMVRRNSGSRRAAATSAPPPAAEAPNGGAAWQFSEPDVVLSSVTRSPSTSPVGTGVVFVAQDEPASPHLSPVPVARDAPDEPLRQRQVRLTQQVSELTHAMQQQRLMLQAAQEESLAREHEISRLRDEMRALKTNSIASIPAGSRLPAAPALTAMPPPPPPAQRLSSSPSPSDFQLQSGSFTEEMTAPMPVVLDYVRTPHPRAAATGTPAPAVSVPVSTPSAPTVSVAPAVSPQRSTPSDHPSPIPLRKHRPTITGSISIAPVSLS